MFTLISDTKIIFLDEPTVGMDPWLRRGIWNTLKELKHGKIIILTTHFMDEAEYLGDRIAIMSHGKL
jgi:ABC-type multidrug transport system ATPase subunit